MVTDARWCWLVLLFSLPATGLWIMAAGWGGSYGNLVPLLLVTALIVGMLVLSAQFRQEVLLGFLVVNTTLLNYRVRHEDVDLPPPTHTDVNWQNYVKLAVWVCLILIAVVDWRKIVRYWLNSLALGALALMIGLYVVSASWSREPILTAASASGLAAYLIFGTLVVDRVSTDVLIRTIIWSLAAWLAASWLFLGLSPSEGFGDGRLRGMSGHPNQLALQATVMMCLLFGAYQRSYISRRAFYACLVLGLVTLAATISRTTIIAFVIALGAFRYRQATVMVMLVALAGVTLLGMTGQLDQVVQEFQRSSDSDVLAGRTDIWAYFGKKMVERPILGYGFNTFESYMMEDTNYNPLMRFTWVAGHPHSNLFEVMFSAGIVGLMPYLVWVFAFLYRWWKKPDILLDLYGLTLVVGSFTDSNITGPAYVGTLIIVILLAIDAKSGHVGERSMV